MMESLYQNWMKSCLPSALFLLAILFSSIQDFRFVVFLIWLQLPIYLIHEFEEHVYPGNFKDFVNHVMFKSTVPNLPLNSINTFWINIPFIWVMFPVCAILARLYHIEFGAIPTYFALVNATLHIVLLIVKRRYNPGCLASIFLNYPAGIYTLYIMRQTGNLSDQMSLYALIFAILCHVGILGYAISNYKYQLRKLEKS